MRLPTTGLLRRRTAATALALAALGVGAPAARAAGDGQLIETGSSLLYPLFNIWIPAYQTQAPGVRITAQSTGSGTGMSQAISGLVQIGASDAYVSNALMRLHPNVLNIPLAISSQMVNYNVPGLNGDHLKLSGPVLAAIYQGKIRNWNDKAIAALNPGVSLPDHSIVPIHRTDGSGDTFLFTQFLSKTDASWNDSLAYGTTITWPTVPDAIGAVGNQGMVQALERAPYSIAYVGISFKVAIDDGKMGEAALGNKAGKFVLPDAETVSAAAASAATALPKDERISLIDAAGDDAYPIINFEYAVVTKQQPSATVAASLRGFLSWAISADGGNAPRFLDQVHFVPLPAAVRAASSAAIHSIGS